MNTDNLIQNMISAARLDVNFFNAVEHDESKNSEALTVVVIAAVASAIGNGLGVMDHGLISGLIGALFGLVMVVAGYYIWAYLAHYIATQFFGGQGDVGEVLRTFGYSFSPQVLGIFGFIPCLGGVVAFVGAIWSLVAAVIALREAMDFDTGKAIITGAVAWIIMMIIFTVIGAILGVGAFGLGALFS